MTPMRLIPSILHHVWVRGLFCAGLLALTSCPSTRGAIACKTNADCPVDLVCNSDNVCAGCTNCDLGKGCFRGRCLAKNCGEVACKTKQACMQESCGDDQCLSVSCARGEACAKGSCYPVSCLHHACGLGQVCLDDQCIDTTCVGVKCDEGKQCVDGQCRGQTCGASVRCADGAVCLTNNVCLANTCVGAVCPEGTECAAGRCLPVTCGDTPCSTGQVCIRGSCSTAACLGLACGPQERCFNGACTGCGAVEALCTDGQDDDCDGKIDCADSDCNGQACNDQNACTSADRCSAGVCKGTAKPCSDPTDSCRTTPGTCEPATGLCKYPAKPALTACDDKNPCTLNDRCDEIGRCVGGSNRSCYSPPNACYETRGTCDDKGVCQYKFKAQGESCENVSVCFSGGACDGKGNCVGGIAGTCAVPTNPCLQKAGSCDPVKGCIYSPQPAGTGCDDGNACTVSDACDGAGNCQSGAQKACNNPSGNQCESSVGTCNPTNGTCSYGLKPAGSGCDDGNGCTINDTCNGAGGCVSGPVCPSNGNPCQYGQCVNNGCQYPAHGDGTRCGGVPAQRCCGGNCVDISNDENHCGGCFTQCLDGNECETVSATNCEDGAKSPASTTGRCLCRANNAHCVRGQVCRTFQPYANHCTPNGPENCAAAYIPVNSCPRYCSY